ncbi:hypothetical protein [Micromonospora humida]|uniref:SMODS-associated NUDIX domain-containing protein n=1 Tax=Micromonospora humida TaxID=2809018 RepID=UPI003425D10D
MIPNIVAGLITSVLLALVTLSWRHRGYLPLLRTTLLPSGQLRVSVATLIRIKQDDCYVLFHHPYRPSAYGPPGGVLKYAPSARRTLDALGFVEHRVSEMEKTMVYDLRGFLPARHGIGFMRWYATRRDRECGADAARRELAEELAETGHPELIPLVTDLVLEPVRTVFEPPRRVGSMAYRTMRAFEVYDVVVDSPAAADLLRALQTLGRDATETQIIAVNSRDIRHGRHGWHLIAPQSAFLLGDRRLHEDLPALR